MSFMECNTSFVKNSNGSSHFTIDMDTVMTKCMVSLSNEPEQWIRNMIENRCRIEGERIYKKAIDQHLVSGTIPANSTKKSLILNHTTFDNTTDMK